MGRWKNVLTDRETFLATWHGDEEAARVASEQADAEREAEQRAASPRVYIDGYVPGGRSENIAPPSLR
jgi:hypothetical protein